MILCVAVVIFNEAFGSGSPTSIFRKLKIIEGHVADIAKHHGLIIRVIISACSKQRRAQGIVHGKNRTGE